MKLLDTVYVQGHGTRVGVEKGALTVQPRDEQRTRIPLEGIEQVVLLGRAKVTDQALYRCSAKGVRIASLSRSGRLRYSIGQPPGGNVMLRVAQLRAFDDASASLQLAKPIVGAKVANSRAMISRWSWDLAGGPRSRLRSLSEQQTDRLSGAYSCDDLDVLRGIEGDAARLHFKAVGVVLDASACDLRLDRRTRRPPLSPVNALLSFCYGLLVNESVGAAEAVGLDAQIGFLHRLRPGRPSLALDLVEEFRAPIADRFVVGTVRRRQLRLEHLVQLPGGVWKLTDDGRKVLLQLWEEFRRQPEPHLFLDRTVDRWALPTLQATLLARHLRGDLDEYPAWVRRA